MAAPSFVTSAAVTGSSDTINVTWVSGVQAGDVALLACMSGSNDLDVSGIGLGDVPTPPTGFTRLGRVEQFSGVSTGRGQALIVFARVCDGTETGSIAVAFNTGATHDHSAVLTIWRSTGGASSFDTTIDTDSNANSTSFTVGALTATGDARHVGIFASAYTGGVAGAAVVWDNYSEHREWRGVGGSFDSFGVISVASDAVTSGSTGTETGTAANSHTWCSVSVLLYGPTVGAWVVGSITIGPAGTYGGYGP